MVKQKEKLNQLGKKLVEQAKKGENPNMDIPIRALSNVNYDQKKRMIMMGNKSSKRYLFNVAHIKKFLQTTEIAANVQKLLTAGKHVSLRQAFYMMRRTIPGTQIDVVELQEESNKAVEDLELVTGFSREELNINANKNGSAAGKIIIKDKGDLIDWSKLGSGGWAIPSNTEEIEFKKVDAKFVIYMEKAAIWERLHEDRVWDKLNCIIISSQGQATRGIRRLLRRLNDEYKLPIYILVDNDPWGYYIYSVLKYGSIALANISEKLAIPSAKLIGLSCEDVNKYGLKKYLIKFQKVDESRLNQIKNYEWFQSKPWQKELKEMKDQKGKVELDALVAKGVTFISDTYLPEKLKRKEFLD
ncbi:MAG: DNA topoisomerase IV subunit A [Candidatus Aenigmarchaeota archaeon]|nr:DNA topoisomerase IV subunit A [Candidatus Aenigmarchaeota archaeon]